MMFATNDTTLHAVHQNQTGMKSKSILLIQASPGKKQAHLQV